MAFSRQRCSALSGDQSLWRLTVLLPHDPIRVVQLHVRPVYSSHSTHVSRHSSRRLALNRSPSCLALGLSSAQPPRNLVVGTRLLPLWRPPQPPWDARLCRSLSMLTCFVSMYGCLCVYCILRPFLAFSGYGAQPWCSPAIILSAPSALVLGARLHSS